MNCFALPGGHVEYGEDPEECVVRELIEETTIKGSNPRLFTVRGKPDRDPRYHVVTIAYWVDVDPAAEPKGGDDAATAEFYDVDYVASLGAEKFAFDHFILVNDIIKAAKWEGVEEESQWKVPCLKISSKKKTDSRTEGFNCQEIAHRVARIKDYFIFS